LSRTPYNRIIVGKAMRLNYFLKGEGA